MNAGLSNLITLKRELLLASDAAGTDYDAAVAALGLGVASMFESYCDRKLLRTVDDVFECPADRYSVVVPRYPIEAVNSVEMRDSIASGWEEQADLPDNYLPEAGLVQFGAMPGVYPATLRITYTGGFWWDTSEDSSGTKPTGATAVPTALVSAWHLQCKFFWDRRSIEDRAKAGFTDKESERFVTPSDELLGSVKTIIATFRRYT